MVGSLLWVLCLAVAGHAAFAQHQSIPLPAPVALNNAALQLLPAKGGNYAIRRGFDAAGDTPDLLYQASSSACSLNSGNGDNGSQVKAADGGCWLAMFPSSSVNVLWFGADPTGVADRAPAVNAMLAPGSNHKFVFPPGGTYLIGSLTSSLP